MTFKVRLAVKKRDQEYTYICEWKVFAEYKVGLFSFWKRVPAPIAEVRGPHSRANYSGYSGKFKESYIDDAIHDLAYIHSVAHYRRVKNRLGGDVREYDLSIIEDFVKEKYD